MSATRRGALAWALCGLAPLVAQDAQQNHWPQNHWPQGHGPNGNWSATGTAPPLRFSRRTGENIRFAVPLPETGQGGIAVADDKLFVTCMLPWDPANALSADDAKKYSHAIEKRKVTGKDILALCLDANTGKELWRQRIAGEVPSIYSYPFSDATAASPVTDGEHVWFTNAGGQLACFTVDGKPVWQREFQPTYDGPFNKQFEPFLVTDRTSEFSVFVHMEPYAVEGEKPGTRWHFLVGLDPKTGDELWRSEDALTHYNAPTLVDVPGDPCILHARGGPHAVPERPVGISMTQVTGMHPGKPRWRFEDPRGNHEAALQTMAYDDRHVYWLLKKPRNALVVLDRSTGKELRTISLTDNVTRTAFDQAGGRYVTETGVKIQRGVMPARYSMIAAHGSVFFQCYATAWGKPNIGPPYSFGRVHVSNDGKNDRVEYLEVPTDVVRDPGQPERFLWRTKRASLARNARGVEVTGDKRSRWDGWDWVFNGSPTRVNDWLYFTLASGVVYVLDAKAERFDNRALLAVNDLGIAGQMWTANSVSYANGRLYHRTAAELLCIGYPATPPEPAAEPGKAKHPR